MKWIPATIGDVCVPTMQSDPARSQSEKFQYVDIAGVDREAKVIARAEEIATYEAPSRARKVIRANDVLVSTVRPNLNAVAIVPEHLDGEIASTGFAVLRAATDLLCPRYLFFWVQHPAFVEFLTSHATGASYPAVTDLVVRRAPVPLPPLTEQFRIVELLDEANHLRRLRREADAKAARVLPALFLNVFGDPETNPMGWPITTIGSVLSSTDYGSSTRASDNGAGLPLIRMGNVSYDGHLDLRDLKCVELPEFEATRFRLAQGDILFNRTNSKELVGKTGIWDRSIEAVFASYFIRLRVDQAKVAPTFLWAFMNTAHMKRILRSTARGAIGQANINATELKALPLYKPPMATQERFATQLSLIQSALPRQDGVPTNLDRLFELLLHRGFSGDLTTKWRQSRSNELRADMQRQARALNLPLPRKLEAAA